MISIPLLIYFVIGPLAWVLAFWPTLVGRAKMNRLLTWKGAVPPDPPRVTILVPAKDEGAGIRRCLQAVLASNWPNFDVVAVNDRSVDDTGAVLDELAAADSRLKVVHVPVGGLPPGWLGKCHALHVGTRQATGEWLFFVDSDVVVERDALTKAMSIAIERKYDAVSILTRLECHSFLERLMLPMLAGAWTIMHAVSITNMDDRKDRAEANGQFFLIKRKAYEAVGGHERVKDQITEDVELMRALKGADFRVRLFMGGNLAATRMHSNLRQMFNGWARIYSGTARRRPWRILGAMWAIIAWILSAYPALAYGAYRFAAAGDSTWLWMAAAHILLMSMYLMHIYRVSGNPMRYALLAPISSVLMLAIFVFSLHKCWTGRITWRDTVFASASGPPASLQK